jgi:hypothetical protein
MVLKILGIFFILLVIAGIVFVIASKDPWRLIRRKDEFIVRMTIDEYVDYAEWKEKRLRKEGENGS